MSEGNKKVQGNKKFSKSPYHEAADLLNRVLESKHRNLKAVASSKDGRLQVSTRSYAVVAKLLQEKHTIDEILKQCPRILDTVKNEGLLYVLLFELLFSERQKIIGGGALKRSILQHEKGLRSALEEYRQKHPSKDFNSSMDRSIAFPRYVRVNSCVTTVPSFLQRFAEIASTTAPTDVHAILGDKRHMKTQEVFADQDVPDLFVVRPSWTSKLLSSFRPNEIILQDKSSCFPALCLVSLLNDGDGDVLDACAAPGNKTSHCAALLSHRFNGKRHRTIYALDRDSTRFRTLSERMQQLVPEHVDQRPERKNCQVVVQHKDFLKTTHQDFPTVTSILLDPSCSGSGLYARNSHAEDDDESDVHRNDMERLQKLSGFQTTALRHALTAFPQVQVVVYSTCSIHEEENECVIANVLTSDVRKEWQLVAPKCLCTWSRRGEKLRDDTDPEASVSPDERNCLIRTNEEDATNGFFVACFQRKNRVEDSNMVDCPEDRWNLPNQKWCIPMYQGEFATSCSEAKNATETTSMPKSASSAVYESNRKRPATTVDKSVPSKSGKKRTKKLEWKRRQQEAKRLRLQEK